jgi:predicted GNAT family acetyltransferase
MEITVYPEVQAFLDVVQPALERDEAANSLLVGGSLGAARARSPQYSLPFMATVGGGGELCLIGLMTPPFPLILAEPRDSTGSFDVLASRLKELSLSVSGVVGSPETVRRFAEAWGRVAGQKVTWVVNQRIYALNEVLAGPRAEGELRAASLADLPLLTRWMIEFRTETFRESMSEGVEQATKGRIERGEMFLWFDGEPRAMAGRSRSTKNTVTINAVYTPPKWRMQGIGTATVAALSQRLLDEGFRACVLYTDLANPISNSIYMKIGYRSVCDSAHLSFD